MSSLNHRPMRPGIRPFQPPQQQQQLPVTTNNNSPRRNGTSAAPLVSRQSFLILAIGIGMGYLLLPVLLVQHLGFDELPLQVTAKQPLSIETMGVHAVASLKPPSQQQYDYNTVTAAQSSRMLEAAAEDPEQQKSKEATKSKEEDATPPDLPEGDASPDDEGDKEQPADLDKEIMDKSKEKSKEREKEREEVQHDTNDAPSSADNDAKKATVAGALKNTANMILNDAEKRIVEDRNILSKQSIPTATCPQILKTANLPDHHRKKILVTGGSGFVGSHLVDKLMMEGHEVTVVDNFFTGQKKNIAHWLQHPNFSLVVHDVTEHLQLEVDQIYHLACPASPPHYQYNPVKTIKTSTMGTLNMLGLAKRVRARILLTSTSEIYGDPQVHPQHESYWGNVNTIGPRSCYDEGKRVAETMMYSYRNQNQVDVRVARIFNTFGPRMHPNDGRVVSNFIIQSLQNKNLTIYGQGTQTRSFQYVSDLVDGLHALMNGKYDMPVNLGNPDEYTVHEFAQFVKNQTDSSSEIVFLPKSQDDPSQRKPDISTAKREIDWQPKVSVKDGLRETIAYFSRVLDEAGEIIPTGPGAAKPEA